MFFYFQGEFVNSQVFLPCFIPVEITSLIGELRICVKRGFQDVAEKMRDVGQEEVREKDTRG